MEYTVKSLVKKNIQITEHKYDIDFDLANFPQTIQELEIFTKVGKAVQQIADDYGIYDTIDMENQFDDEVWENDIFPTADSITLG